MKNNEFLKIQERAGEIYRKYLEFRTVYLKSKEDETQWLEISWYKDEECYAKSLSLINNHQDIQELFASFQAILASGKDEISEQEYDQIEEMSY